VHLTKTANNLWRSWPRFSLVILIAAFAAGCQAYKDGSSRTIGEFTDDARIQAAVKTALISDEEIAGWPMNIEVHRGVVGLYGRIPSETARAKAIRLAGEVRGVVEVQDRLTLVPPN